MKARIYSTEIGSVIAEYDTSIMDRMCGYADRVTREFCVLGDEGLRYVREYQGGGEYGQVCERLSSGGSTLMATHNGLLALIRREYRRMRYQERKMEES